MPGKANTPSEPYLLRVAEIMPSLKSGAQIVRRSLPLSPMRNHAVRRGRAADGRKRRAYGEGPIAERRESTGHKSIVTPNPTDCSGMMTLPAPTVVIISQCTYQTPSLLKLDTSSAFEAVLINYSTVPEYRSQSASSPRTYEIITLCNGESTCHRH
jgi:hypothetical protein